MSSLIVPAEMEKSSVEDDCVDSGAETGGSDYSPLSSTSSELSMGELQDPFLVSVHLIADPGQGKFLQHAADAVLEWVHPELQLFRVSERACVSQRPRPKSHLSCSQTANGQPALAVIVFLQETCGGKEQILMLHHALQRPPWRYHHTEEVSNGRRMLPLTPCSQDFFTLAPGTPLWAVRQVHYGKEIVRFTVYSGYKNYGDMVRLYKLLLQRRVAQKKEDFCFFVIYSNPDMEIQLSLKRLPRGQSPVTLESAVMEVRVRDVGALVPLLPNPCSPISEVRWRTEDYDGNKILLQVQAAHFNHTQDPAYASSVNETTVTRSAASCRNRRHHRATSRSRVQRQTSLSSLPLPCEDEQEQWAERWHPDGWRAQLRGHHQSASLYSLPNLGSASSSPGPSPSPHHRRCSLQRRTSLIPPFRLNVDALIGAEETDVDTGRTVHPGSGVDLTVVSAYIQPSLPHTPRRSPVNPEDISSSLRKVATQEVTFVPVGTNSLSTSSTASPQDLHSSAAPSLSDVSMNSCSVIEESCTVEEEEDEQEFYI